MQRDSARPVLAKARRKTRRRDGECDRARREGGGRSGRGGGKAAGRIRGAVSAIVGAACAEVARGVAVW
jgi:hypothetical protein